MGDLVTYRRAQSNDPGLIAHCVYLKTEEKIARAAMLILHWIGWYGKLHRNNASSSDEDSDVPELIMAPGGGDHFNLSSSDEDSDEQDLGESEEIENDDGNEEDEGDEVDDHDNDNDNDDENDISDGNDADDDGDDDENDEGEEPPPCESVMLLNMTRASIMALVSAELLLLIGIRDNKKTSFLMKKMVQNLDLKVLNGSYEVFVNGQSCKDVCHAALRDLLDHYGSVFALHDAVTDQSSTFDEQFKEVLINQIKRPAAGINDNTDKDYNSKLSDHNIEVR
ncbi:hypothetical protein WMY93_015934 [Mugilogobius chulae]|uniref:Uncharacterized protein n=1 Tax=Mugilogobius chulae TaxID=88201 RepID=A0AAW0NSL5_9GOBI